MEKFSLYDFLGLLLPGVIFLFFGNVINNLFGVVPILFTTLDFEINIVILLCFALIIGATLYVLNFHLIKTKWYNRIFGMHKHVADIYLKLGYLHPFMNKILNQRAMEWYKEKIFLTRKKFEELEDKEKKRIRKLQDKYYDRMYYELEYLDKNEISKAFQSFYYFFRQTALACVILLFGIFVFQLISLFQILGFTAQKNDIIKILWLSIILIIVLIISVLLAKWYRKRLIMKIYQTYFNHIQITSNTK